MQYIAYIKQVYATYLKQPDPFKLDVSMSTIVPQLAGQTYSLHTADPLDQKLL